MTIIMSCSPQNVWHSALESAQIWKSDSVVSACTRITHPVCKNILTVAFGLHKSSSLFPVLVVLSSVLTFKRSKISRSSWPSPWGRASRKAWIFLCLLMESGCLLNTFRWHPDPSIFLTVWFVLAVYSASQDLHFAFSGAVLTHDGMEHIWEKCVRNFLAVGPCPLLPQQHPPSTHCLHTWSY